MYLTFSNKKNNYFLTAKSDMKWDGFNYRNDPKFSDGQVLANSADPDQTAPRGAV